MKHTKTLHVLSVIFFFVPSLLCQKAAAPAGPAAPASTSLTGLSYANGDWNKEMPSFPDQVLLCYKLAATDSASQPFTLEPQPIGGQLIVRENPSPVRRLTPRTP